MLCEALNRLGPTAQTGYIISCWGCTCTINTHQIQQLLVTKFFIQSLVYEFDPKYTSNTTVFGKQDFIQSISMVYEINCPQAVLDPPGIYLQNSSVKEKLLYQKLLYVTL